MLNVFPFLMCDADREREAVLEAGVDGSNREGLVTVQQFTTWQGGLAEPCTHLPTFSHTVGRLYRDLTNGLTDSLCTICSYHFVPVLNVHVSVYVFVSLVHSGPDRGSPHSGTELFFATRTGTRLGIETHLFRAETTKDLSLWTRHIVNGCHASAEMIKEVTTSES